MKQTFLGLPKQELTMMLGTNAADWYGFETDKLRSIVDRIGPKESHFA
jgi:hypothetical protein